MTRWRQLVAEAQSGMAMLLLKREKLDMKRNICLATTCLLLCLSVPAHAACTISATPFSFLPYDSLSTNPTDSTGSISIACNEAPPPDVTVQIGRSATSSGFAPRSMKHSSLPDLLHYNLFTSAAMNTIWGDGTGGTPDSAYRKSPKNKPEVVTIYGRMPAGQDISAGTYSDSLVVTILW